MMKTVESQRRTEAREVVDQLLPRAARSDFEATEGIFRAMRPGLMRFCRSKWVGTKSGVDAEDVVQETMLEAYRNLPGFKAIKGGFHAFVYTIAAHKLVDAKRKVDRERSFPVEDFTEEWTPQAPDVQDVYASGGGLAIILREGLESVGLTPDEKDVVALCILADYNPDQAAAILGKQHGAIRSTKYRVLTKLRNKLPREMLEGYL